MSCHQSIMRVARMWLMIAPLLLPVAVVLGCVETEAEGRGQMRSCRSIAKLTAHCPHTLERFASPEQVTGVWFLQEAIGDSSSTESGPCIKGDSKKGGNLIAKIRALNEEELEVISSYDSLNTAEIFVRLPDGMWEHRDYPSRVAVGLSSNGLLVWCGSPTPPGAWSSMLLSRQPSADAAAIDAARSPEFRSPRLLSYCTDFATRHP